jgi:hypothetical protein
MKIVVLDFDKGDVFYYGFNEAFKNEEAVIEFITAAGHNLDNIQYMYGEIDLKYYRITDCVKTLIEKLKTTNGQEN